MTTSSLQSLCWCCTCDYVFNDWLQCSVASSRTCVMSLYFLATDWRVAYMSCLTNSQCQINPSGGPMPTRKWGPSNPPYPPFPFPFLPLSPPPSLSVLLPLLFPFPPPFPSLPLEVGPLKYSYRGSAGAL